MAHITLPPEDLYAREMRLRLARAGLLKIMREVDTEATVTDADAVMKNYVLGLTNARSVS